MYLKTLNIIRSSLLDLPIIKPVIIEGPISISEYIFPAAEPKRIYLFGDVHVRDKTCLNSEAETITLENFLESTFEEILIK